jgi:hypothetical protein
MNDSLCFQVEVQTINRKRKKTTTKQKKDGATQEICLSTNAGAGTLSQRRILYHWNQNPMPLYY